MFFGQSGHTLLLSGKPSRIDRVSPDTTRKGSPGVAALGEPGGVSIWVSFADENALASKSATSSEAPLFRRQVVLLQHPLRSKPS
jgi:hypothetical protein